MDFDLLCLKWVDLMILQWFYMYPCLNYVYKDEVDVNGFYAIKIEIEDLYVLY